ncbi:MAG: BadF/BadG/BcrA/BcrD ATPase family protein [Anaerolineae bacterium]|nr:BadF/BadG/BcrA/BcrD ATPase family protein [Anaerolineae bacterium]
MSSHVLGVDGGTSKTIAFVADDQGRILGAARGAGSNWSEPDVEVPMKVVVATVREALQRAGLSGDEIAMAAFCLAGADWPEDHERRHAYLATSGIARRLVVKNDSFAGLRAGTSRPYGVVIAAGTGVNAAAIAPDGREWAFGYYVDEGGAADVSREAIRAVLRQDDGRGPATALTPAVLERLGYATGEALLRAMVAGEVEPARMYSLCPLVFEAAEAGDEVAAQIVVRQGKALARYATTLIRRFEMSRLEFDVVLAGSLFKGQGPLLVDTITQAVHQVAPRAHIVRARFEPAVGAVLLAYDALGVPVTEAMYAALAETSPHAGFFDTTDGGQVRPVRRRRGANR